MYNRLKQYLDAMAYPVYVLNGRKPWAPGYYTAKRKCIQDAIDRRLMRPEMALPSGYGYRLDERVIEYPWVFERIEANSGIKILDAGSALNHEYLLSRKPVADAKLAICTLAPEKRCFWENGISYVFDDLRSSMFRSEYFDVVVSISTIEHIGLDNTMLYTSDGTKRENDSSGFSAAVKEFRRLIKPGGKCFITVPYGKAQVRGWFQIFDAPMVEHVLNTFQPSSYELEYFGYHKDGWRAASAQDLVGATFFDVHQDGKPTGDMAAGARGVVCMQLNV